MEALSQELDITINEGYENTSYPYMDSNTNRCWDIWQAKADMHKKEENLCTSEKHAQDSAPKLTIFDAIALVAKEINDQDTYSQEVQDNPIIKATLIISALAAAGMEFK
jgi:hypothetical protein